MRNPKNKPFEKFDSFEDFFRQAEERPGYWEEKAKLEFTGELLARMEELKISRVELANRLGVRPGFITRLLSGQNNFELATMVKLARALGCEFRSHLQPPEGSKRRPAVLPSGRTKHSPTNKPNSSVTSTSALKNGSHGRKETSTTMSRLPGKAA